MYSAYKSVLVHNNLEDEITERDSWDSLIAEVELKSMKEQSTIEIAKEISVSGNKRAREINDCPKPKRHHKLTSENLTVSVATIAGAKTGELRTRENQSGENFAFERTTKKSVVISAATDSGRVVLDDEDITELVVDQLKQHDKKYITEFFIQRLRLAISKQIWKVDSDFEQLLEDALETACS